MSLEDNCGKFGRTKMIFFVTLPGGLVLCVPGQYRVFPPLAAIIAASRRGILVTRRWRRCTRICAHLSSRAWRSSSRFWGGLSIELIARPNSSQRCSIGLQSGDLGGCSIFVTFRDSDRDSETQRLTLEPCLCCICPLICYLLSS